MQLSTVLEWECHGVVPIITKETGHSEDSIHSLNDIILKNFRFLPKNEDEKNLIEIQQKT